MKEGNFHDAVSYYTQAISHGQRIEGYRARAIAYKNMKEYNRALSDLRELISLTKE